jgi:CDP-diacylglycerol--serine O-phosphatidyltransferase
MLRHLPNFLTLCNLFCGCCAFLYTVYNEPVTAAYFSLASMLFDYADGMVARALRVSGPLGKELDSLADVISFGAVPGAMLYMLLRDTFGAPEGIVFAALPAFVLSMFSGLRLGKFNLDTRQAQYFIGLSTPACTVFVLGLRLTAHYDHFGLSALIEQPVLLYGLVALLSWLLISEVPMFGMKIKRFDLRSNTFNLIGLGLFLLLVWFFKHFALSLIIVCYIVSSILLRKRILKPDPVSSHP